MPKYKQSYYNFVVSSGKNICIYNTKTGCVGVLSEDKTKVIKILNNPDDFMETNIFKDFLAGRFIVEFETNEIYEVASNFTRANNDNRILNIIILPTEFCNFNCPYCFVKENKVYMGKHIYKSIIHYIDNYYKNYSLYNEEKIEVSIGWFGGEPTLCASDIICFMEELGKRQKHLKIQSKIVTNGYLLTTELFKKFLDARINNFQVTLDGTKENHDKLRVLKNGAETFEVIYNNLLNIKNKFINNQFEISIRGNFNKSNVCMMEKLALKFKDDFGEDNRFDLSFRPILEFNRQKDNDTCNNILFCSKQEALCIQSKLANLLYGNNGLETSNRMFDVLPEPINKWCNVTKKNSIVVDSSANIFACDSVVSDKNEAIGRLEEDGTITYNNNEEKWRKTIFQEDKYLRCQRCKLLPVCLGGCTRERIQKGYGCCTWTTNYVESMMKEYCEKYKEDKV